MPKPHLKFELSRQTVIMFDEEGLCVAMSTRAHPRSRYSRTPQSHVTNFVSLQHVCSASGGEPALKMRKNGLTLQSGISAAPKLRVQARPPGPCLQPMASPNLCAGTTMKCTSSFSADAQKQHANAVLGNPTWRLTSPDKLLLLLRTNADNGETSRA